MKRLAPALLALSAACTSGVTTMSSTEAGPTTTVSDCVASMAEYLVSIEQIVADFDPTTMALREFYDFEDAAGETLEPDLTAPYTCEDEGLNWAYFSLQSDWEKILSIAREQAPESIPFMEAFRRLVSLDEPAFEDVALPSCEDAALALERALDDQLAAGNEALLDIPFDQAIEILTLSFATELGEGAPCITDPLRAKLDSFYPPREEPATTTSAP